MLSPGKWHERVPKERGANLRWRRYILDRAKDKSIRPALIEACREDIIFYINTFVYQYNPLKIGNEVGPFTTWDFQDVALRRMLWCLENNRSAVIEKSREMGGTYLCVLGMDWLARFFPHKKFLIISRDLDSVDKAGDPDSVMWKMKELQKYLPDWLRGHMVEKRGYLGYESKSVVTGEASTGKAGIGGRATLIFIDEFSRIDEDAEVRQGTASTTNCRWFNGTHQGVDKEFFRLTQQPEIEKIQIHWSQHPEKRRGLYRYDTETNKVEVLDTDYEYPHDFKFVMTGAPTGGPFPGIRSPWYDWKVGEIGTKRGVSMDLDMDPKGASSQVFDELMIAQLINQWACDPWAEVDLRYDADTGDPKGFIPTKDGLIKLWCRLDNFQKPAVGRYTMGADIASGTGATATCFTVLNAETGDKVLEYASAHILPEKAAPLAVAICNMFKDAHGEPARFAWEMQGPGMVFGKKVLELGFRNIYYRTAELPHSMLQKTSDNPGWNASPDNKRLLLEEYANALRSRRFLNRSKKALEECLMFRWSANSKIEHMGSVGADPAEARENHADRVIADALAWKMAEPAFMGRKVQQKQEEAVPVLSLEWRRRFHQNEKARHQSVVDW